MFDIKKKEKFTRNAKKNNMRIPETGGVLPMIYKQTDRTHFYLLIEDMAHMFLK